MDGDVVDTTADISDITIMVAHTTTMTLLTTTTLAVTEVIVVPTGTASALQNGAVVMETIEDV